jgi:hypothetical protein
MAEGRIQSNSKAAGDFEADDFALSPLDGAHRTNLNALRRSPLDW